jgi:hypothetical protein
LYFVLNTESIPSPSPVKLPNYSPINLN